MDRFLASAMARRGLFAHRSANGTTTQNRVRRFDGKRGFGSWSVGENLLRRSPAVDGAGAVRMGLRSPRHRRMMLRPHWREVGFAAVRVAAAPGVLRGREVMILTADFGVRR